MNNRASAQGVRTETTQTLPILQARFSPMTLTPIESSIITTDQDAFVASINIYDEQDIDVPSRDTITTYVVQSGDTLSEIADRFNVSTNTIRWANSIPPKATVRVGQSLVILPITGVKHIVVKGDTIAAIAKKYKADIDEVASYNNIEKNERLTTGTTIIVPDGDITFSSPKITKNTSPEKTKGGKSTDSLYKKTMAKISGNTKDSSAAQGYFIKPMRGIKTQGFHGPYNAVDIGAPVGTTIVAAADGVVLVAKASGYNGGYGGLTIIQHDNGSQSLYAHQSSISVEAGQRVSQGQKIGESGNTGRSTGPHLHLEFRGIKTPILY